MQEEQRIILKMLEEGKITAAEAEALLNALGEREAEGEGGRQEDFWARLEKQGEEFAEKVESAVERFYRSLESKTEALATDKLAGIPKILARFPFIEFEEAHEFIQVFRGELAGDLTVVPTALSTFNGSIKVRGWSEGGYQLTVTQRLRGKDRELARKRLHYIDWVDGETRQDLNLEIPALDGATVSLELMVPRSRLYAVDLQSHNGSLQITDLQGTALELETSNGSALLRQVKGESVFGKTNNGSCQMDRVEADSIQYRLNNGSYRLRVQAGEFDCTTTNGSVNLQLLAGQGDSTYTVRTTNGSIAVKLPSLAETGVNVDLRAAVGRVTADLGPLEISQKERGGGGGLLVARTFNYADQGKKIALKASSSSGSISVRAVKDAT
ncbi:MAG TPA: DUF4097 domain-containing protein [Firmicutes bacterium]|nr:DUF4097 domain-containing protein [Bacillota bacterium]